MWAPRAARRPQRARSARWGRRGGDPCGRGTAGAGARVGCTRRPEARGQARWCVLTGRNAVPLAQVQPAVRAARAASGQLLGGPVGARQRDAAAGAAGAASSLVAGRRQPNCRRQPNWPTQRAFAGAAAELTCSWRGPPDPLWAGCCFKRGAAGSAGDEGCDGRRAADVAWPQTSAHKRLADLPVAVRAREAAGTCRKYHGQFAEKVRADTQRAERVSGSFSTPKGATSVAVNVVARCCCLLPSRCRSWRRCTRV